MSKHNKNYLKLMHDINLLFLNKLKTKKENLYERT